MSATYARTLRIELDALRTQRIPFERAWPQVLAEHPAPEDWSPCMSFVERHFQAAFNRDMSKRGRCRVEHDGTQNRAATTSTPLGGRDDVPRCRSKDECDRPATRGRFGKWWCDHHGAELERIAQGMDTFAVGTTPADAVKRARESGAQHMKKRAA